MSVEKEKAVAVGHIPSGLYIVCAYDKETEKIDGFLASWVQQVSFDPLLISLCVRPGRPAYEHIVENKVFSINVVGEHDKTFLKHFWSGYDPEKNVFSEIPHQVGNDGEVIIEGARSTIVCKTKEKSTPGDHDLVVAEVLNSIVNKEDVKSMVHMRKSGLDY